LIPIGKRDIALNYITTFFIWKKRCHKIRAQNQTWSGQINYNYKRDILEKQLLFSSSGNRGVIKSEYKIIVNDSKY